MDITNNITTIGVLVGALFILIGLVGGGLAIKEISIPTIARSTRIACVVAGVFFIGLPFVYAAVREDNGAEGPPISQADDLPIQITINSPRDTEVSPNVSPSGVLQGITLAGILTAPVPAGAFLWILDQDADGTLYKQSRFSPPQGDWSAPLSYGRAWCGKDAWLMIIRTNNDDLGPVSAGAEIELPPDAVTLGTTHFTIKDVC